MLDPELLRPERVRPLRRREYEALVDRGMFGAERLELLRGVLVVMSPQGDAHATITAWLAQRLIRALDPERFDVRSHSPFAATDDSEPEPDVSVSLRRRRPSHPRAAHLLIEVSDSSLAKDRVIKTEVYAEAGVPEYWIVDVKAREIEILTRPSPEGYRRRAVRRIGDVLRPVRLRGVSLVVADLPWGRTRAKRR